MRDAEQRRVEPATQKRGRPEPNIPASGHCQRRGEQAQPCRDFARGKHVPDDPAALRKPVNDRKRERDPVIEDVLLHPQAESSRGTRGHERRARSGPPPDVDAQAHGCPRQQRHDNFRVGAEAPKHEGGRADDEEGGREPRNRPREEPLDQHELETDEKDEARQRHALQRDDAGSGDGEHRSREVDLGDALVALSPQKRGMLALKHVAGHQAFHGLVRVEKPISLKEKRRPGDDHQRRDEEKLDNPAALDRPIVGPDR